MSTTPSPKRPSQPAGRRAVVLLPIALAILAAGAWLAGIRPPSAGAQGALRGIELAQPIPKPDFTLTDTHGRPFDFRARTAGSLTLLYFGYTHCADICPTRMRDIAAALAQVRPAVRRRVRVVFISTDPDRDSAARIRQWLDGIDPTFIGLRGPLDAVNAAQAALHLGAARKEAAAPAGAPYQVTHAAELVAFSPDGPARVLYPPTDGRRELAHDLPLLVAGGS